VVIASSSDAASPVVSGAPTCIACFPAEVHRDGVTYPASDRDGYFAERGRDVFGRGRHLAVFGRRRAVERKALCSRNWPHR